MERGTRVKAGPKCEIAQGEPYVQAWVNEGEEGTVVEVLDYIEFAEARPTMLGSAAETALRARGAHEQRRYVRVMVRFDFGITLTVDSELVTPV
jgi:hypothetical protein